MTVWRPDTCDCVIEYNENINWIKSHEFCKLHKSKRGQNHLNQVIAQNQRFNLAFGRGDLLEEERKILILSKRVNKLKIRSGDFTEDIPERPIEMTIGFWENIRSRLPF